jgi:hypothetical protein
LAVVVEVPVGVGVGVGELGAVVGVGLGAGVVGSGDDVGLTGVERAGGLGVAHVVLLGLGEWLGPAATGFALGLHWLVGAAVGG